MKFVLKVWPLKAKAGTIEEEKLLMRGQRVDPSSEHESDLNLGLVGHVEEQGRPAIAGHAWVRRLQRLHG